MRSDPNTPSGVCYSFLDLYLLNCVHLSLYPTLLSSNLVNSVVFLDLPSETPQIEILQELDVPGFY